MDESDKRMETMASALQNLNKEPHGKEIDDEEEERIRRETWRQSSKRKKRKRVN